MKFLQQFHKSWNQKKVEKMPKKMIKKRIDNTVEKIIGLRKQGLSFSVSSLGINNVAASFSDDSKFFFKSADVLYSSKNLCAEFEIGGEKYSSDNVLFFGYGITSDNLCEHTFSFSNLRQDNFPKKSFFRIVLPLSHNLSFYEIFDFKQFCCDGTYSFNFIKAKIKNNFEIFIADYQKSEYLFIDCMKKVEFDEFYKQAFIVLVLIGFFTGKFVQDKCYVLSFKNKDFEIPDSLFYKSLGKSVEVPINLLVTNLRNLFSPSEAENNRNKMAHINQCVFNNLGKFCYDKIEILNSIIIIIESSVYGLETAPVCLAVALEGITGAIMEENKATTGKKEKFIDDKFRKQLTKNLDAQIDSMQGLEDEKKVILKKRIQNLFQLPNQDKLEKPFEILNITLKEYEKTAINNRNAFLHSRLNFHTGFSTAIDADDFKKNHFETLVLTELLYKLLLKHSSYDGYILNPIKFHEEYFSGIIGGLPDEELLEKV